MLLGAGSVTILTDEGEDASEILLTLQSPSEFRQCREEPGEKVTALLTARGRDHNMSADQLENLGNHCLKLAKLMRNRNYA